MLRHNRAEGEPVATKSEIADIEKNLTKGQLRKLNALRKSVGSAIGERAFVKWLRKANSGKNTEGDRNADLIAGAVQRVLRDRRLRIPRGGYLVRRVRGWVIVKKADT